MHSEEDSPRTASGVRFRVKSFSFSPGTQKTRTRG